MQKSLTHLLLQYLSKQYPKQKYFSLREIYDCQERAQEYYYDNLPFDPKEKGKEIVERHGYTPEQWRDELWQSHNFAFIPTEKSNVCNKEMKNMFKGHDYINEPANYVNYLASLLSDNVKNKKPYLSRKKINGLWHYKLIKTK